MTPALFETLRTLVARIYFKGQTLPPIGHEHVKDWCLWATDIMTNTHSPNASEEANAAAEAAHREAQLYGESKPQHRHATAAENAAGAFAAAASGHEDIARGFAIKAQQLLNSV